MNAMFSQTSSESLDVSSPGSLWRRFVAFIVDALLLYVLGRLIGYSLFNTLSQNAPWTLLVGFLIALSYFSVLESRIGVGQTLGKYLLRLKVVDSGGAPLSWPKAAARFTVFSIPVFLVDPSVPQVRTTWVIPFVMIFLTLGIAGSTIYLVVCNGGTRQGVHDLAVGAYVVDSDTHGQIWLPSIRRFHWWVVVGFLVLVALTAFSKGLDIELEERSGYVDQTLSDEQQIEKLAGVRSANVRIWTSTSKNKSLGHLLLRKPATIIIQSDVPGDLREMLAEQAVAVVLNCDPRAQRQALIQVEVGRSYSLGFVSDNDYEVFTHTPVEWNSRMSRSLPAPIAH